MIYFLVPAQGDFGIVEYLSKYRPKLADRFRIIHYEDLPALAQFTRGTYVLAGLDQLTPAMEELLVQLCRQLAEVDGVRILNDPKRSLRRFDLLNKLHQLKRNEFRAVRAGSDFTTLRYPVFLRGERSHDGAISPLLGSPLQVEQAIGKALVQGHPLSDLLVVEFCSTMDHDGLYRKYAAFIVGDRVIPRSLNQGRDWMLKFMSSEFTKPLVLEEHDYVFRNPHANQLAEIFAIAGIDYGRIDYSIKDGRIQTWEINLNATIGRGPGAVAGIAPLELQPIRDENREFFFERFREAWEALDSQTLFHSPVSVTFEKNTIGAATAKAFPKGRFLKTLRAILRPIKPVLEPLSAPFLRMLGFLVRWAHSDRH